MLVGIRPGDAAYLNHTGATYHSQDESDSGNMGFYEITASGDSISFDVRDYMGGFSTPILTLNTHFGATDFTLFDTVDSDVVVAEQSGYSPDIWMVDISATSGRLRLTDFDTDAGVNGTQAAWLPYIRLDDLSV